MKTFEKFLKVTNWIAWAAFVYGMVTLEAPSVASCISLVFSAIWLISTALLNEELAGDDA